MTERITSPHSLKLLIESRSSEPRAYLEDARSERILSYAELSSVAAAWHELFNALVMPKSGTVVLDIADTLSFAAVELAVISYGLRAIPVDPNAPWGDVEKMAELVEGAQLIVSSRNERTSLKQTAMLSVDSITYLPIDAPENLKNTNVLDEPLEGGAIIMFTSGSTGTPKGVELPEAQLLYVGANIARHNKLTPDDRGYNSLPLFHINGQVVGLISTLIAGATLVLDARFHRENFWELLHDRRITWMNGAPAILSILARTGEITVPPTLRFIRSASAPLPDIIRDTFKTTELLVSYGMTEGASQITATPLGEPSRPGSVGIVVGNEIQIRDTEHIVLPVGEVGIVWIRGEGVVKKYLFNRAAERFDHDGWLETGDLGRVDNDGYVYLMGRSDDVINRGGEKLYPAEIENVLLEDDQVQEAVVAARADEVLGQVPVAYVIPVDKTLGDEQQEQLAQTLTQRCEQVLSKFKRPAAIHIVDDLPRAATGKFQRVKIREKALDE